LDCPNAKYGSFYAIGQGGKRWDIVVFKEKKIGDSGPIFGDQILLKIDMIYTTYTSYFNRSNIYSAE
jgi:hypothetical protein